MNLPLHPGLSSTTRLGPIVSNETSATVRDWLILLTAGVLAACASTFLDFNLRRIPGHAILRVVFPMAVGLALVPRRGAGTVMGGSALITGVAFRMCGLKGEALGFGALTSLVATGPLLDWTLRRANGGWRQYVSFALAGLASNLLALTVRGLAKAVGWERLGSRPLIEWLAQAAGTYVACGLLAGLLSGLILFYGRGRGAETPGETEP
ncbi:MAG: hypothetical protein H7062_08820 [Candidatus Saccharimonas sp.]|nr:hypothetical protein [Planctomycetaceae bacterium]